MGGGGGGIFQVGNSMFRPVVLRRFRGYLRSEEKKGYKVVVGHQAYWCNVVHQDHKVH